MKRSIIEKIDLKKELKPLYSGKAGVVQCVTPGSHHFLTYDGSGDPNTSPKYKAAVEALFTLSYHLKFSLRKKLGVDYGVMPLEGLWWSDDMQTFSTDRKHQWKWTMMIMQPGFVTDEHVEESRTAVTKNKGIDVSAARFCEYSEPSCAQILHVGPFADEGPTVARLHDWIISERHKLAGKHHEIYLTDIRRADPSKWKTLIRQPFA
jgi:hypothetical protein